jgi:recombinational DNA repair protein (RecF pathway)
MDHGYVKVIAKAARRPRSKLRPLVEPGRLVAVEFSLDPQRELQYLRAGGVDHDPMGAVATLESSAFLLGALELVDRCRPLAAPGSAGAGEADTAAIFQICDAFVRMLSSATGNQPALLFFAFECELLARHGMIPEVRACAVCGVDLTSGGGALRFSAAEGGVVCGACARDGESVRGRPLSEEALTVLHALTAAGIAGICSWPQADSFDRALRREIGAHLHYFLGYHLPGYRLPTALDLLRAGKEDRR